MAAIQCRETGDDIPLFMQSPGLSPHDYVDLRNHWNMGKISPGLLIGFGMILGEMRKQIIPLILLFKKSIS